MPPGGERITKVEMRAFRGVRGSLAIDFPRGTSAVVFGENATGKSTVADAVECYFRGEVAFLKREGREHAIRHVGAEPDSTTSVTVATTGSLGGTHVIDGTLPRRVLEAGRETFLLRGRTLTEFVESTKAEKWRVLAELLGLEDLDRLRLDLQRARNELRRAADQARRDYAQVSRALRSTVPTVDEDGILGAVSMRCSQAGIAAPSSFEEALSPQWSASLETQESPAIKLASLLSELHAWSPEPFDMAAVARWNELFGSRTPADHARLRLFDAAESVLEAGPVAECPLCGQPVDESQLRERVHRLLEELRSAAEEFQEAEDRLRETTDALARTMGKVAGFVRAARAAGIELPAPPEPPVAALRDALERHERIDPGVLTGIDGRIQGWLEDARSAVQAKQAAAAPREQVLVEIGVLVEQARRWRDLAVRNEEARRAFELSEAVFTEYQRRQHARFAAILDRISGRVAEIYSRLHPGEELADVCIEPWGQKGVELAVSFHGTRQKPPHGVLSESHLNSLAVALFLAMADTFNERLGFLVLDDVVNSFDNDHRGQLAELLARGFEHRQLIVLTHDQLFFQRLARLAPSWKKVEFTSWDFAEGPRITGSVSSDMLEQARQALEAGNRVGAGQKGRRALEEFLQEICEAMEAPLPFRRGVKNDRREIGELMGGLRRMLREAHRSSYEEVRSLLDSLDADVAAALNLEAHASAQQASSAELRAAIGRIQALQDRWTCQQCGTRVWFRGSREACRCKCGATRFPPSQI